MFTNRTNTKLHISRQEKNGEIFISPEEVIAELKHYADELYDKIVYIPNTKNTFELASRDAFVRLFEDDKYSSDFCIKELRYSFYDKDGNFVLIKRTENSIEKTVMPNEDEDRLYLEMKQIDDADVIICNPEGNKTNALMKYIYLSQKDFIICVNKNHFSTREGFLNFKNGKTFFGVNIPTAFYNVNKGKMENRGDTTWITSFDIHHSPNFLSTFWTYEDGLKFDKYKKYDNYNAINVDEVCCIPMNYKGIMGIPVTFLPILNKEQFEVIGLLAGGNNKNVIGMEKSYACKESRGLLDGKVVYARVLVRFRNI